MNEQDPPTGDQAKGKLVRALSSPPPPRRANTALRAIRSYRTGRILALILGLISILYAAAKSPLSSIFTPAPPPDTVTITLTWDEWGDLQNAAWFIQGEISTTLTLAGDYLSPATIDQAQTTIDHFDALKQTLVDQAFEQTTEVPNEEINSILDDQLERQEQLVDLLAILDQARLDWLVNTLQP